MLQMLNDDGRSPFTLSFVLPYRKNEIPPPLSKGRNTARQTCTKFVIAIIADEVNALVMIIALVFRCGQEYGGKFNQF